MKTILISFLVMITTLSQSSSGASEEEVARFLGTATKAFETHNADALIAITYWERVSLQGRVRAKAKYAGDVAENVTKVELKDPAFPDLESKDKSGVIYRSNLPVIKQLVFTYLPGGPWKAGIYPVGEKDGKLYLLESAPVK